MAMEALSVPVHPLLSEKDLNRMLMEINKL